MVDFNSKKSALDRIKDKLYSKTDAIKHIQGGKLKGKLYEVKDSWEDLDTDEVQYKVAQKRPFFFKLLVISGLFFAAAILVSIILFFLGSNSISTDNVIISISGPTLVEAGESVSLQIGVLNKNNVTLKNTELSVRFPEDSRDPENLDTQLLRVTEDLGDVREGERDQRSIKAAFFGQEGAKKEVVVSVEYTVDDSTAVFQVEKQHTLTINSAPVGINVEAPSEATAGSEVTFKLEVVSNSNTDIDNLVLKASYPFGFDVVNASPDPDISNDVWEIESLRPEDAMEIEITGVIEGQNSEDRVFRFSVGVPDPEDPGEIKTSFFTVLHEVQIARPNLSLAASINGDTEGDVVVGTGQDNTVEVAWSNNSSERLLDARLYARISGEVIDERTIKTSSGFYNSSDDMITWNGEGLRELREIRPGDGGKTSFQFSTQSFSSFGSYPDNPQIRIEFVIEGKMPQDNTSATVRDSIERVVLVGSNLDVVARSLYHSGPLDNSGPIPPKAEEETTYTVSLSLANTVNDLSGVRVVADLPEYVSWVGEISPNSEDVSYSASERRVVWNVGSLERGIGHTRPSKEVFFKLAIVPSLSQVGSRPAILRAVQARGEDNLTGENVIGNSSDVTTQASSDPGFGRDDGRVVQ